MKVSIVLAGLFLALLPVTGLAAPRKPHTTKTAQKSTAAMYECSKCHMKYTAAQAKKYHYKDPMDGGQLVPVKTTTRPTGKQVPKGAISM